jgi:hypothetical protein
MIDLALDNLSSPAGTAAQCRSPTSFTFLDQDLTQTSFESYSQHTCALSQTVGHRREGCAGRCAAIPSSSTHRNLDEMPPPAIFTFTSDPDRLRLISVIAATVISLACGTNVGHTMTREPREDTDKSSMYTQHGPRNLRNGCNCRPRKAISSFVHVPT